MLVLVMAVLVSGQVKVGVKGGLSTYDIQPSSLIILDQSDVEDFKLELADAKFGLHIGMFFQITAGNFVLQPELIFNSNSVDYTIEDIQGVDDLLIRDESFQYLDIPLLIGVRMGPLRLNGGPVGHVFINSTSDLFDVGGYDQNFERLTYGWQAGAGLDIWRLHLDFRYEGNFSKFGDHIIFFGKSYSFDNAPSRLIASLGLSF